jgi:hypothetical protein
MDSGEKIMKKNIGAKGRIIRFVLGAVVLTAAYFFDSWILYLVALFIFFEVLTSWCVICQILGHPSCPRKRNENKRNK